ncbi:GNAT family N-acetyltransferase [Nocardioides sp. NPDC047086]|uniref:GNAT family N-acetyltransferase n=1 Tax=Nocardioides sp. NPDC047086 TaxID=3154810 RepID=UPI00340BB4B8
MNSELLVASPAVATRPVRPDDLVAFERMWSRLSEETIYRRFHAPVRRLSLKLRRYLVDVDHRDHDALVAISGGEVIAVARYHRCAEEPAAAEVAVLVEDAWQGRGLGARMLRELACLASRRGIDVLTGDVQSDNLRMLGLVRSLLDAAALQPRGTVVHVRGSNDAAGKERAFSPCR